VYLTPALARAFQAELKALVDRYTRTSSETPQRSQQQYSFITAIAQTIPR